MTGRLVIEPIVAVFEAPTQALELDRSIPLDLFLGRGTFVTNRTRVSSEERWKPQDRNAARGSGH